LRNEGSATSGRATHVAKWASTTFLTWLGVGALVVAIATAPADAKKRKPEEAKQDEGIADIDTSQPMVLVVSLKQQKLDIYRGTTLVTSSAVSTGMPGHATKAGVFSILEKQRFHHSNIYSGAPMPWMNRITWSGTAFHAGVVPGYPASHGCIRLPFSFAPKLFKITTVGDNVVVARDRPVPRLIEHPALFQPLLPPPAPAMVTKEPPQRQSMNDVLPLPAPHKPHPGMLARADVSGSTTDVPSSIGVEATGQRGAPTLEAADPAAVEDTHAHAFDPFAGQPAASSKSETASTSGHALDDEEDGAASKPSSVAAKPIEKTPAETPAPTVAKVPAAAAVAVSTPIAARAEAPVPAPLSIPVKVEPAPVKVEPAPAKPEITAKAMPEPEAVPAPVEPVAAATPAPAPAPIEPVVAAATPTAPAPVAPPAVQAVATTPQASMVMASAEADATPSISESKLGAGTRAAAIQAAEPRSTAPLRILVTRRTQRDRVVGVQKILSDMGYLEAQDFDGTLGKATATAIKTFQRNNGMAETGAFNEDLVKKIYEVAGKGEPPVGHLFVRQEFGRIFDGPVTFKDPETPLGTHIFTALKFAPGDTKTQWMTISVQGDDGTAVLDRIEIPADLRQKISERLTPGSSLIVGDTAINTATLTKGSDFLVWAKDTPAKITAASLEGDLTQPKPRKKKRTTVRRSNYDYSSRYQRTPSFRGYPSWPW
jgi:lipoprotein-anchoring transpeptidase ErfK/SrfK/peptidoglycan hydrolase-like protein with peptidoglycan-binding domain